jgi:serine/threonine protein kinase
MSPSGTTIEMGEWKIHESGISRPAVLSTGVAPEMPTSLGSGNDFVLIGSLGSGASGVVNEAIHVPSLTIVALKMLPIYNQEKRKQVSRELAILHKNLSELSLVESLETIEPTEQKTCPNILSMYNAFVDPKSGLINLVIEFMDGGSLEDLVQQVRQLACYRYCLLAKAG